MKFRQIGNEARTRYYIDHQQVSKEEFDRVFEADRATLPQVPPPAEYLEGNRPWTRPLVSEALAYHARQVPAARQDFARKGLDPNLIRSDGKVVLPDRATRRAVLKANGMRDNQGGYSD